MRMESRTALCCSSDLLEVLTPFTSAAAQLQMKTPQSSSFGRQR
jgi:hypothetical protein